MGERSGLFSPSCAEAGAGPAFPLPAFLLPARAARNSATSGMLRSQKGKKKRKQKGESGVIPQGAIANVECKNAPESSEEQSLELPRWVVATSAPWNTEVLTLCGVFSSPLHLVDPAHRCISNNTPVANIELCYRVQTSKFPMDDYHRTLFKTAPSEPTSSSPSTVRSAVAFPPTPGIPVIAALLEAMTPPLCASHRPHSGVQAIHSCL